MGESHERETGDERQRRIEALRTLSGQQAQQAETPVPAARPSVAEVVAPAPTGRSARRRWLAIGSAALAVCVVVAAVLVWVNRPRPVTQKPLPDPRGLAVDGDGFTSCSQGGSWSLAWSPDGSHIGRIGFRQCGGPDNSNVLPNGGVVQNTPDVGGMLGIFDIMTGKRIKSIALDTPIVAQVLPAAVRADTALLAQVQIMYDHVIWSPDGKTVAVTFYAAHSFIQSDGTQHTDFYGQGLLLVDWQGGGVRVLQQPQIQYATSVNGSTDPLQATLWNLTAGTAQVVNVPQALAYQWTAGGTLAPAVPLPALGEQPPAASTGPVGKPVGGKQFTVWQSGYVSYGQRCTATTDQNQPFTCCPVTEYLTAFFGTSAAWSPDGTHLLVPYASLLGAQGKVAAPGGKTVQGACAPGTGGADLARLPLRDPALAAAIETLTPPPPQGPNDLPGQATGPTQVQVAWSPDGRYLAVEPQNGGQPSQTLFSIYDTASGQVVGTITQAPFLALIPINQRDANSTVFVDTVIWSADGRHLLANDMSDHAMVVFGPKSLGLK